MIEEHQRPWRSLSPEEVMTVFSQATFPWWIAGGHAIEHFVGRVLRSHDDIDVLLLRVDQRAARTLLAAWDCWAADPPGTLRPWAVGETLPPSVSDVWCRESCDGPWRFQLMLDDGDDGVWRSRRSASVTRPIAALASCEARIPFLAPEVQLYYKAKAPRPKDELDFAAALPLLSEAQRVWLRDAIVAAYGQGNAWLCEIDAAMLPRES